MYKKVLIFSVTMLTLIFAGCQKPEKKMSVSQFDPASEKFSFLNKSLEDIKILAIGESSYGFGGMQTLKGNLVKYLHEDLNYNLLILEASYGDVEILWYNYDEAEPDKMLTGMMPSNMHSEQMLEFCNHILEFKKGENPLEVGGMDTNITGKAFNFRLMHVIRRLEPKVIQDSIEDGFKAYVAAYEALDNEEEWKKNMDRYIQSIDLATSIIVNSREDIKELELVKEPEIDILLKQLDLLKKAVGHKYGETYTRGLELRDSLMAENVADYLVAYPNTKVIIWGHNGHIEKGPGEGDNIKWLGHYLKERYGDDYYAMGMFAKKGFIYQKYERKTSNFEIKDPSFIESKIDADYGKNVFIDLPLFDGTNTSWVNKPINGYELEAGGKVRFVPSKRFDGVLLLGETEAPVFLSEKRVRK